jgi:hypothetical protein
MERKPVCYGDLDLAPPTPKQYHENLLRQIDNDAQVSYDTPTWCLERMIDTNNFIPLITEDYKLAFCQVTRRLPELCQVHIWKTLIMDDISIEPPHAPKKTSKLSIRMNRWAARKLDF